MRKQTENLYERDLMKAVAGQLFDQAPNRQPRKVYEIMRQVRDNFRKDARKFGDDFYYLSVADLPKYVYNLLFNIPEFKELNLSQIEFEQGVKFDDKERPRYRLVSRFNTGGEESWKRDIIDLDAFSRNVVDTIYKLADADRDCMGCIRANSDLCSKCYINPDLRMYYKGNREPKGIYTFSCKYDCPKGLMICCEECNKENCDTRCDSQSEDCGLAINRLKTKNGKEVRESSVASLPNY